MSRFEITVLALLVVLVLGVFGVAVWLYLRPAAPVEPPPTPTPWSFPTFPPTWTPVVPAAATAAAQQQRAGATVTAIAQRTAVAQERLEAALVQFPAEEIGLRGDAGSVGLTLLRAGWVRYGTLWLRVQVENRGAEPLPLSPQSFTLLDAAGTSHAYIQADTEAAKDGLRESDLPAGGSTEAVLIFALPLGTLPGQLIYEDGVTPTIALDIYRWLTTGNP